MVSRQATIETLHDLEEEEERGEGEGGEESEKTEKGGGSFLEEARHQPPPEGNVDWGPHSSSDSHLLIARDGRWFENPTNVHKSTQQK